MRSRERSGHQAAIRLNAFESRNRAILASPIRAIRSYDELLIALSQRRASLGKTMLTLDSEAGLADGHSVKIFCKMRNLGPMSFSVMLGALKARLVLEPDE